MIRIVFPYILFVSLVSLAGGVLNVFRRFAIPGVHAGAAQPVDHRRGAVPRAVLRPADHGAGLGRAHRRRRAARAADPAAVRGSACCRTPRFDWRDEGVRRVLLRDGAGGARRVGGADLGADQHAARRVAGRRPHLLDHLRRPADGVPDARCWASRWARCCCRRSRKHHADARPGEYSSLLDWGLRLAFLLALPAAVALWLLAVPLIATLYQYGRFTANDVLQTREALLGYSVGLLGLILVKILAPGFYARQKMKTPVKIAFVTVLVAQTLALLLMSPHRARRPHAGDVARRLPQRGAAVLVPAAAAASTGRGRAGCCSSPGSRSRWACSAALLLAASAGAAGALAGGDALGSASLRLALVCAAGAAVYFAALWLLGFRLRDFNRRRRARRRRARREARALDARGRGAGGQLLPALAVRAAAA